MPEMSTVEKLRRRIAFRKDNLKRLIIAKGPKAAIIDYRKSLEKAEKELADYLDSN